MELYKQEEYYKIVGICMEVHRTLGGGLLEIVYKDALEYELSENDYFGFGKFNARGKKFTVS